MIWLSLRQILCFTAGHSATFMYFIIFSLDLVFLVHARVKCSSRAFLFAQI